MSEFKIGAGTDEDQLQQFFAYLFAQSSTGSATTGVLAGLTVAQTTTASASVLVNIGAAVSQSSLTAGADVLVNNAQKTIDVLGANPMGAVARNDLIVFNPASAAIQLVVDTPNVTPTDPSIPTGAVLLARLSHAASATTVPTAKIDNTVRTTTYPYGGPNVRTSAAKSGKRFVPITTTVTPNGTGYATVTHGLGFTPAVVVGTAEFAYAVGIDSITSTTLRVRLLNPVTSAAATGDTLVMLNCWE